ncbi:MAG: protease complex subunit PrcB family protein [Thalassolituus sp.]|jgi:hypothetical protein|uniref:PrcB C-terminal domain-containing protein n=1 Tax=Thalassolituus oleivorans MIL-1 TaxID=1298593 RepID=M5DTN4_9GAMM|nr:protease complex subunit PrcB family protein [Thalassolituus oleivorans]MBQ0728048.1 protease complex subunit PrcB family protein [Thalassolituus oleivorans]MBQ0782500.1 protease complex subunit PrcB family protein [Thalassolituus oleivorans]MDF1641499.1 protease complex subunit PrcB family protein [Thalassolituus oleivorans]CCU72552.1 hypothetical protein TOL_2147 [Thalassolituus oleivorans MIL-1]
MTRLMGLVSGIVFVATAVMAGCAGQPEHINLPSNAALNCVVMESVVVVDGKLTIAAGEKPTPGYSVELSKQQHEDGDLMVEYFIATPPSGRMLPQMMTSPCRRIELPRDWHSVTVVNRDTSQQWVFEHP